MFPRVRIDAGGTGGRDVRILGVEVGQIVGTDDEVLVGVDGPSGADDLIPVTRRRVARLIFAGGVRSPGEEMGDENRVVARGVELAVRLIADLDALDRLAADRKSTRL